MRKERRLEAALMEERAALPRPQSLLVAGLSKRVESGLRGAL